jgi:hypothetical protein
MPRGEAISVANAQHDDVGEPVKRRLLIGIGGDAAALEEDMLDVSFDRWLAGICKVNWEECPTPLNGPPTQEKEGREIADYLPIKTGQTTAVLLLFVLQSAGNEPPAFFGTAALGSHLLVRNSAASAAVLVWTQRPTNPIA